MSILAAFTGGPMDGTTLQLGEPLVRYVFPDHGELLMTLAAAEPYPPIISERTEHVYERTGWRESDGAYLYRHCPPAAGDRR